MKNNKGFSLVELIVVIAIMAILAAVAVIGVSVYIPKAQQAADKQLVSDVEYALTLAGYNGDFVVGDSGYIILVADGNPIVADDDKIVEIMQATYGSDWQKEVALAYDGWIINKALLEAAANGQFVPDSIYMQNSTVTELLGNVQAVTQAAAGAMGTEDEDGYVESLKGVLGSNYLTMAKDAGLIKYDQEAGEYVMPEGSFNADGTLNADMQTQLSNLMVLSVSKELQGLTADQMGQVLAGAEGAADISVAAKMALWYSVAKAVDLENGGNTQEFKDLNTAIQNAENSANKQEVIFGALTKYEQAVGEDWNAYLYKDGDEANGYTEEALKNFGAVGAVMSGVDSVSGDYMNAESLKNANLFTTGSASNYMNLYAVAAGLELPESIPANGIVLIYQMGDDGVMHVYPLYQ